MESWQTDYPGLGALIKEQRHLKQCSKKANTVIQMEWITEPVDEDTLFQMEMICETLEAAHTAYGDIRRQYERERENLTQEQAIEVAEVIAQERLDIKDLRIETYETQSRAERQIRRMRKLQIKALKQQQEAQNQNGPITLQRTVQEPGINVVNAIMELVKKLDSHTTKSGPYIQRQPIKVPTFDGEPENFKSYWTRFNSLIHNEPTFSVPEKINMLFEGLSGKAKKLVNVDPTEENYEYIRKLMEKEYGAHKADLYNLLTQLQAIQPAPLQAQACDRVHRNIKAVLRKLETGGATITRETVVSQVLTKFPFQVVKKLIMTAEDLSAEEILDKLHDSILEFKIKEERKKIHESMANSTSKPTLMRTHTATKSECIFCEKGGHSSDKCQEYSTPEERRRAIRNRKVCWICLSTTHFSRNCEKSKCETCHKDHNKMLCLSNNQRNSSFEERKNEKKPLEKKVNTQLLAQSTELTEHGEIHDTDMESENSSEDERIILHSKEMKKKKRMRVILKIAEAEVFNHMKKDYEKVNVIIDEGSTRSMVTERVAETFKLPIKSSAQRTFFGIGGVEETHDSKEVTIKLRTRTSQPMLTVATMPSITIPIRAPILSKKDKEALKERINKLATPYKNGEKITPEILIGMDCYAAISDRKGTEEELPSGLIAKESKLGTLIYGTTATKPKKEKEIALFVSNQTEERELTSEEVAQKLFNIDNMGIGPEEDKEEQITREYYKEYAKKIRYKENRIIAPFPIKENINDLKDNKTVALKRLHCLLNQLDKNQEQNTWYNRIMNDYIQKGVVERIPRIDIPGPRYYIPHHGVWKPEKAKPLRIVFDASSHMKGAPSLNDVITTGSIFINKIHDIIIANRFHKIIMMCDIEAAFTQIKLSEQDKDLCRFFWIEPMDGTKKIVTYRFCRLPFGITSSPSILNMCLTHFLENEKTELAQEILNLLYVDNITIGAEDENTALTKYKESKELFKKISMNIREYISNNSVVNDAIPTEDKLDEYKVKMLGIPFNIRRDELTTQVKLDTREKLTKRIMLSQLHKSYDPIGMITPLLLHIKLHLRKVFNMKKGWDEPLDEETTREWNELVDMVAPAQISIARYIPMNKASTLWIFADASMMATAVCAYIQNGDEISDILTGKIKLAPKRTITIPKLELIAIRMAFSLANNIVQKQQLCNIKVNIASDSHIALDWISSNKKQHRTVEHHTNDIIASTKKIEANQNEVNIFHVATEYNPADIGTRGMTKEESHDSPWIKGPQWITCSGKSPLTAFAMRKEIGDKEQKDVILLQQAEDFDDDITEACLKTENHRRNMATTAYIGKFIKAKTRKARIQPKYVQSFTSEREITEEDYQAAKNMLIHIAQITEDYKEIQQKYRTWDFFKDDQDIIRIRTRLQNADLPYDTKNPIWLPRKAQLTNYIITQTHKKCGHQGREMVQILVRQRYYLPKPMSTIKTALRGCIICARYNSLPIGSPEMADLPKDRVTVTRPFASTGCDLMGPFILQGEMKTHVCLFTCMATRAIHLELVPTASAESFINALQRFTARRGVPKMIRSDNGSNFVLGNKVLSQIVKERTKMDNQYKEFMHLYHLENIKWVFNTPLAPWKGGAWERLIGIVKTTLHKAIGRYKPSLDEMNTIMVKIEMIVNCRPMTHTGEECVYVIPIRPIDFLSSALKYSIPDETNEGELNEAGQRPEFISSSQQAMEAINFIATVTGRFWTRWRTEYLTAIKDINKKIKRQGRHSSRTLKVGDVVILKVERAIRGTWPLGRIVELIESSDGQIRSAIVSTNGRFLERSLELLYPLEISTTRCRSPKRKKIRTEESEESDDSEPEQEDLIPIDDEKDRRGREKQIWTPMKIHEDKPEEFREEDDTEEIIANEEQYYRANEEPRDEEITSTIEEPELKQAKQITRRVDQRETQTTQTWVKNLPNMMATAKQQLEKRKTKTPGKRVNSKAFLTLLAICSVAGIVSTAEATPSMYCEGTNIVINTDKQPILVCIDDECNKIEKGLEQPLIMKLKAIPGHNMANIRMITETGTETTRCIRSQICHKATFLSRNLLGNPHCWPWGAQLSAFIYLTTIMMIIGPLVRWMIRTCKESKVTKKITEGWSQSKEMARNLRNLSQQPTMGQIRGYSENPWAMEMMNWSARRDPPSRPPPSIYHGYDLPPEEHIYENIRRKERIREKRPIPPRPNQGRMLSTLTQATMILMITVPLATGCQDTHTRYITELKCDNRTHCYYQFGREMMFNSVTSKICVQMMHNNMTIGSIELEKMNSTLSCRKEHLYYTRITEPRVETIKRCKHSGSCQQEYCTEMNKEDQLDEFHGQNQHAGQAGCSWSCGGWLCGCGMIFSKACSFYRLYHKPTTDEIFDVFKCAEFTSEVTFKVNIIIKKQLTTEYFKMRPYQKIKTPFFNATIVSATNQYSPLIGNRFARSENRTIMIESHDDFTLRCRSKEDAKNNQRGCHMPDKCNCQPHELRTSCECPTNALEKNQRKQTLPVSTNTIELRENHNAIVALQKADEILFYLESNLLMDSASSNVDYPCVPTFSNISGCYDCPTGAKVDITCMSTIDTWTTIQCGDHIRSIECAPTNPNTRITMYFEEATVSQQCYTQCANTRRDFTINGILHYHELEEDTSSAGLIDNNWTKLPDLNPLGSLITTNWKTSTALTGISIFTSLISYAFGAQALTVFAKPLIWFSTSIVNIGFKLGLAFIKALW